MVWEKGTGRYVRGENYRLGKWLVGSWSDDTTLPNEAGARYSVTCFLPGIRSELGNCENKEAARALLETAVKKWLAGLPADIHSI